MSLTLYFHPLPSFCQKVLIALYENGTSFEPRRSEAKHLLSKAYAMIDAELRSGDRIAGNGFTLADCSAAPALFYSNLVQPFAQHGRLSAYFGRLMGHPSFAGAVDEARFLRNSLPISWARDYG